MTTPSTFYLTAPRRLLVDWLNSIGYEKRAEAGSYLVVDELISEAGYEGSAQGWSQLLYNAEKIGIIERETHGRRTIAIRLAENFRDTQTEPVVAPAPSASTIDIDVESLATAVFGMIVERLATDPKAQLEEAHARLFEAQQFARKARLREREHDEALSAAVAECDALRRQVRQLEAAIEALRSGDGAAVPPSRSKRRRVAG